MNTNTGSVYELGKDFSDEVFRSSGPDPRPEDEKLADWQARVEERIARRLEKQEREALADIDSGGTVVPVSDQVAQTMRLGQRELTRRQRRRKAAKQARKHNRSR